MYAPRARCSIYYCARSYALMSTSLIFPPCPFYFRFIIALPFAIVRVQAFSIVSVQPLKSSYTSSVRTVFGFDWNYASSSFFSSSDKNSAVPSMRVSSVYIPTSLKASAFPFVINKQGSYVNMDMSNSLR
jgi:hypothetical protein